MQANGRKVLVADDDTLIRKLLGDLLSFYGYDVDCVSNGKEAIALIETGSYDVLITDYMMPEMNGLEVLDKLKLDPEAKKIPVVVLTNLAGGQDAEIALSKGAVKYIVKSEYEPKQIANMIKEVLAGYTRDVVPQAAVN